MHDASEPLRCALHAAAAAGRTARQISSTYTIVMPVQGSGQVEQHLREQFQDHSRAKNAL